MADNGVVLIAEARRSRWRAKPAAPTVEPLPGDRLGRNVCADLDAAERLVTNRIGGYASGTVAGLPTWGCHGLLIAARAPHILAPFADQLRIEGLGTIGEIFEGAPPHAPRGCIAQAWSVGEVLRTWSLIDRHTVAK
jgi:hypothetical protein